MNHWLSSVGPSGAWRRCRCGGRSRTSGKGFSHQRVDLPGSFRRNRMNVAQPLMAGSGAGPDSCVSPVGTAGRSSVPTGLEHIRSVFPSDESPGYPRSAPPGRGGDISLSKLVRGYETVLDSDTYSTGSEVAVRIKLEGTSIKAWVGGTLEIDTKDSDLASRGVYPRARPERESADRARRSAGVNPAARCGPAQGRRPEDPFRPHQRRRH